MSMQVENSATEKIYSNDGRFYADQTKGKTKFKDIMLYNLADIDNDKVLSESEINRWNSPIVLTLDYDKKGKKHREVLCDDVKNNYAKWDVNAFKEYKPVKDTQQEFYTGVKREDMKFDKAFEDFDNIDEDGDGVLSEKEMKDAAEIYKRFEKVDKIHTNKLYGQLMLGGGGGIFATLAAGLHFICKETVPKYNVAKSIGIGILTGVVTSTIIGLLFRKPLNRAYDEEMGEYKNNKLAKTKYNNLGLNKAYLI